MDDKKRRAEEMLSSAGPSGAAKSGVCRQARAVSRVILVLVNGVHPTAITNNDALEKYPKLKRFEALQPVCGFEGERPSSALEALLYSKRDRGSTQSIRKRRKIITRSEESNPTKMELPPLEHYIATHEQLCFHGFPYAKLTEPCSSSVARISEYISASTQNAQPRLIRESEIDRLNLLLPEAEAEGLIESAGEIEGYCFTFDDENDQERSVRVFAMDCEMVETSSGFELARLSIVQYTGETTVEPSVEDKDLSSKKRPRSQEESVDTLPVLDVFVLPQNPVLNYLTKYSGVTREILNETRVTFVQARAAVLHLLRRQDILVGHSLENDLKCMRIAHKRIVDTSILYAHPQGPPRRASLKWLAKTYLNKQIHDDERNGHDSVEDARTALLLSILKVECGPHFGLNSATFNKQSVAQLVSGHSLQQENQRERGTEPPSRAIWVSHVASLGFHIRPGVEGFSFQNYQVSSLRAAFEKALGTPREDQSFAHRDLIVLPIDAGQLTADNDAEGIENQEVRITEPGISEAKVAELLGQGLAPRTLEALDKLLSQLEETVASTESQSHEDDKSLVLFLAQVDVKTILDALKQKQACSSVRSASIWTPRQQKLLKTMTETARSIALSFSFW